MILALLATAVLTFFFSEAVGYSIHRLAHWPKSGKIFRNHLHHHSHAYPPSRYQSEKYLGDLKTSFIPIFIPVFLLVNLLAIRILPLACYPVFLLVSSAVAVANNYFHDSFHVSGHWLSRFKFYGRLKSTHLIHHENVKKNLGIYWYGYDKVIGSFRKPRQLT
jgi:hypothetical protein